MHGWGTKRSLQLNEPRIKNKWWKLLNTKQYENDMRRKEWYHEYCFGSGRESTRAFPFLEGEILI